MTSGEPTPTPVTSGEPTPTPVTSGEPTPTPVTSGEPTPTPVTSDEPTPTPVTSDETIPSQQLSLPVLSSSSETDGSATTQDQPWMIQQSAELSKCREFVRTTCGCRRASGNKPCSTLFMEEHYIDLRAQASFLTHEQLDLVILGSIMATVSRDEFRPTYTRHKPAKRQKIVTTYMHHGHHLCKATYNFLHGVGNHRVKAVKQSYLQNGLSVRTHGNTRKLPHNALSYTQTNNIFKIMPSKMPYSYQVAYQHSNVMI